MQVTTEKFEIDNRTCYIYLSPNITCEKRSVVYVHDGENFMLILNSILDNMNADDILKLPIIVGISSENRLDDYTPWPADSLTTKFPPFGGKGDKYLDFIVNTLKPYIDKNYPTLSNIKNTFMMGFSLGGLIALYSAFNYKEFGNIVSISGSFWYECWIEYINNNDVINTNLNLLMISGKNEGKNKLTRHKDSYLYTLNTNKIMNTKLINEVPLILDDFKHHENQVNRYTLALKWIIDKIN
ncbi:hypothetical protein SAMN02745163_03759 [Clostridium cavendishii DSM 21758]|uniref:Esterase n=1 Tax=Clostridium cavendishii DSM 21758 TaxID=1121302 RepID=A0A1M6SB34_9CLOT|nr:alpha/beta hydrolase-fold protein [Clostridium cavendishii]SHK41916.1 hypothetical protein SAMN02745163_03759 [Clostridium cavendishii DSM 21758]